MGSSGGVRIVLGKRVNISKAIMILPAMTLKRVTARLYELVVLKSPNKPDNLKLSKPITC